jgi:hypothetical protein
LGRGATYGREDRLERYRDFGLAPIPSRIAACDSLGMVVGTLVICDADPPTS